MQVSSNGIHIVRKGQNLYAIARAYKTPLRAVIDVNNLQPPYKLREGQRLKIPRSRSYVVRKGDTVYAISRRFNVAMNELVRVNRLKPPYPIQVGQRLQLPGEVATQSAKSATPKPVVSKKQPVKKNTTVAKAAPRKRLETRFTKRGMPKPPLRPNPPRVAARDSKPVPISKPPKRASSKFLWPVRGRVISSFGPKGKGLQNDGLNIAAPRGTPVKASENGVVAYSGNRVAGYGNLILIKHSGGYMTAYAHNGDLLVKRGDQVRRGQTIARVGSSGNVDRPQLHFQVRKGKRVLNPRKYLGT